MQTTMAKTIYWELPNRRDDHPLHISTHGTRYSTVTGVSWLDENSFVGAHRNGLSIGYFNLLSEKPLICEIDIHHMPDKISAKKISSGLFELAVSGSWECEASIYLLNTTEACKIHKIDTLVNQSLTFSHGVYYSPHGELLICFSSGEDPRISIGKQVIYLPKPFGPRDIYWCAAIKKYFIVGVSENPKTDSYQDVRTGIWTYHHSGKIELFKLLEGIHSDSICVYGDYLYLTDQGHHRIILINSRTDEHYNITSNHIQFPHDIKISDRGKIAVANYGNSSITIFSFKK